MGAFLDHLAYMLADERAKDVVLDQCAPYVLESVVWRDMFVLKTAQHVVWEVKYLHTRGLLCHHPLIYNLVRLKGHDEKTPEPSNS